MCAVIVGTNLMRAYQRVGEQRVDNSIVKKHGNEAMDLQLSGLRPDNGSQVESAGQGNCEASIGTERMDTLLPFNRGGRGEGTGIVGSVEIKKIALPAMAAVEKVVYTNKDAY